MQSTLFPSPPGEKIVLRPYQAEAVRAVYDFLRTRDDNPCIVIPTGGGKTPVIAQICRDTVQAWQGRALILAHVKELLEQSADKLRAVCPEISVGVYSAGLGRRDTRQSVIVAGIQSIYQRACELDAFDIILVDEAHLIPPDGEGMYRRFLTDARVINPHVRVIGLTATPFRLSSGPICTADGILNDIAYEVGVRQLIVEGYLSPLLTKKGSAEADLSGVHVRGNEYVAGELETAFDDKQLVEAACREIIDKSADRKSVLIFACGVNHGRHVAEALASLSGQRAEFVGGDTPASQRDRTVAAFKSRELKYLANVNVFTTGFDAPNVDCVVLLRSTLSPGLYYQMVGRGFRLFPGKRDCLVLDFGRNILRHGPVDLLKVTGSRSEGGGDAPAKECPQCQAVIAAGYGRCPQCDYEFPPPERSKHGTSASDAGVLSGQVTVTRYDVVDVVYSVHVKRLQPDAPKSMRVDYYVSQREYKSEWICVEHDGYARDRSAAWWRRRSADPVPVTAEMAVRLANNGSLAEPKAITVRHVSGDKFERITDCELGPIPEPLGLADCEPPPSEFQEQAQPINAGEEIPF